MLLYLYQTLLLCLLLLPLHLSLYRNVSAACFLHHSVVVVVFYWLRHYRHSYYDVLIDGTVRSRIVIIVLVGI